jgi:hypothetical protein
VTAGLRVDGKNFDTMAVGLLTFRQRGKGPGKGQFALGRWRHVVAEPGD